MSHPPPRRRRACACRFQVLDLYSTRSLGAGSQCMLFYPGPGPPLPRRRFVHRGRTPERERERKKTSVPSSCVCGAEFLAHAHAGRGRELVQAYNTILLQYKMRGRGVMGWGSPGINRLGFGTSGREVLSPIPFLSLAPLPISIRKCLPIMRGGSLGPWRERAQVGPRAELPPFHQSHLLGGRGQPSPRSVLSATWAPNPASSPSEAPPSVGAGVDGASAKEADVGP